jgi:hypothetical protein
MTEKTRFLMCIITMCFVGLSMATYVAICSHYPKYKEKYRYDPLWVQILKMWVGGIIFCALVHFSPKFIGWLFS